MLHRQSKTTDWNLLQGLRQDTGTHERLKLSFGDLEAFRSKAVDFSVRRSAGGLYVVGDVCFFS
ncbi:hypothetical protein E2C01_100255 [Portunus trituberculatus]|uniref:Uncharacterized protein n=1 Tax=Portunus trituberculatus TaxID=210409 RepID=A0A5B7KBJ4_PORTR|nr:hypothetical protein [Portunus trituberculatus]